MTCEKVFYTLTEAANKLAVSEDDVTLQAALGMLLVCFHYRGDLGIYSNKKTQQKAVWYFDGYLRSLERVSLNRKSEKHTEFESIYTTADENRARMVNVALNPTKKPDPPILVDGEFYTRLDPDGWQLACHVDESDWRFHIDDLRALAEPATSGMPRKGEPLTSVVAPANWIERARVIATEYISRHKAQNLFPNQSDVCNHIEEVLRKEKICGTHGRPVTASYVQRNAIQGDWWKANKP